MPLTAIHRLTVKLAVSIIGAVVTLTFDLGQRNRYEPVTLNTYSHRANIDIDDMNSVQKIPTLKNCSTANSADRRTGDPTASLSVHNMDTRFD